MNIIFSGGGFKGWAYIGTIRALHELISLKNIKTVTGVSIGSVFGLFYILNIPYEVILENMINLNFRDLIDIDIDNILVNQSILDGIKYRETIKEIMSIKIDTNVTFKELYYHTSILFTVNALNINNSEIEYFNHINTPTIKVIDAILASSSLPFIFPAYKINENYYYDGGLCNNCPVNFIDELNTIAFDISGSSSNKNNSKLKILDLLYTLINISNKAHTNENNTVIHQILDSRFTNETLNINQTRDDIFNIYMIGYRNSKNIIFDNYIALPPIKS